MGPNNFTNALNITFEVIAYLEIVGDEDEKEGRRTYRNNTFGNRNER